MSENINVLIINWYSQNKRELPWRNTKNPYLIWLSEIILQQTRVLQGLAYYEKFAKNFPTISDLALASEQEILNNWQGLGYYSRARNLHKTAKIVHEDHNGLFPATFAEIQKLPGIGDYTASAIASFSFDEAQAVLDGNVFRVLSRLFAVSTPIDSSSGKKEFRQLAQEFLNKKQPALHNQAIMEFGALLCTPKNPDCENCPLRLHCEAQRLNQHRELPIKSKKTKVQERKMVYLYGTQDGKFVVSKRKEKDIWQHLFEFPLLDRVEIDPKEILPAFEKMLTTKLESFSHVCSVTHLLSHQKLQIEFYKGEISNNLPADYQLVSESESDNIPFPRPIVTFLQNLS